MTISGKTGSVFAYSIPPNSSQKFATDGLPATTATGSIRVIAAGGGTAPTPLVIFSYSPKGVTASEAGVPVITGTALRVYVECSGAVAGGIQSGIAVANTGSLPTTITLSLTELDGTPVPGLAPVALPLAASAQISKFLTQLFPSLPSSFQGVLRIASSSSTVSAVGLRARNNERGDFLITTTSPNDENAASTAEQLVFPHFADGGGYTTQFILFSGFAGQNTSGNVEIFSPGGLPLALSIL